MKKLSVYLSTLLLSASLSAANFGVIAGVHNFIVSDIQNDVPTDGISAGNSHTLGLHVGGFVNHTTPSNINLFAKIEVLFDNDKDNLDPDHIPIWFDSLVDIDGPVYSINKYNDIRWHLVMDNKQNTVSCIEREMRQHVGVGYQYTNKGLTFELNTYLGFYYIEIDDDTPLNRGYTRQDTDDGEASHVFELEVEYTFNREWSLYAKAKTYIPNVGDERLEDNFETRLTYINSWFGEGTTMNFKVKHVKYNFDRFYKDPPGVSILPFDNETLIQAYCTIPIEF